MKKLNCWEFKKCGRQLNGDRVLDLGICPAVIEISLDGIHEGEFGGRACWALNGTICRGDIQGSFVEKHKECDTCDFFEYVKTQEGDNFIPITSLLKIMADYNNREL